MILYNNTFEREGNDSYLIDRIELIHNGHELYLVHHKDWNGWQGELKEDNLLMLNIEDVDLSQDKINEFLIDNSIEDGFEINLKELIF